MPSYTYVLGGNKAGSMSTWGLPADSFQCSMQGSDFLRKWHVGVFVLTERSKNLPGSCCISASVLVLSPSNFLQKRNEKKTFYKKARVCSAAYSSAKFLLQSRAFCWTRNVNKSKSQNSKRWICKWRRMRNWRVSLLSSSSAQCCSWSQFWMQLVVVHSQVG